MPKSRKSDCPTKQPGVPVEKILEPQDGARVTLSLDRARDTLRDFLSVAGHLTTSLGNPTLCRNGKAIWDCSTYRVIADKKRLNLEVPPTTTRDQAFDAVEDFLKSVGLSDNPLSGSEIAHLEELGRQAATGHEKKAPRMTASELREFVMGYCNGQIWTDRDIPSDQIGTLFAPISLGALALPKNIEEKVSLLAPPTGDRPGENDAPKEPKYPPNPKPPAKLKPLPLDPKKITEIRSRIDWQLSSNDALTAYETKIQEDNARRTARYQEARKRWRKKCAEVRQRQEKLRAEYEQALAAHEKEQASLHESIEAWESALARHRIVLRGATLQYLQDIGRVWENDGNRNASPMSVNGHPCFFSCHVMHKKDWESAIKAIKREMRHRERISVRSI